MLNTKQFEWDAKTQTFSGEISELGAKNLFQRIYPDACDIGFELQSNKTNFVTKWCLVQQAQDHDEDITDWVFRATPETVNKHPALEHVTIIVFND